MSLSRTGPIAESQAWLQQAQVRWRREPSITRIVGPTLLERARKIGYRAKKGIVLVRVRIRKGGARRPRARSGRRQKSMGVSKFTRSISIQEVARGRVRKRFPNLLTLGSYPVGSDGRSHWFEVVLKDPAFS